MFTLPMSNGHICEARASPPPRATPSLARRAPFAPLLPHPL